MDDSGDMAAAKEALGIIKQGLRSRSIQRKAPGGGEGEPDGNVGEVMEREPEIEVELEQPEVEIEVEEKPLPEKRTVLESFVPRTLRAAEPPASTPAPEKRGPGRPKKRY